MEVSGFFNYAVEIMSRNHHRTVSRWVAMKGVSVRYSGWRPVAKHGSTKNVLHREWTPDRHKNSQYVKFNIIIKCAYINNYELMRSDSIFVYIS